MRTIPLFLFFTGCTGGLSAYNLGEVADETGTVSIESLDPAEGKPKGGTEVTLLGAGFEGEVEVYFGTTPAEVTVLDSETLLAVSPKADAGTVDVTVVSDFGEAVLENGFTYARDATDSGAGTPDPEDEDYAGLTGGFVHLLYVEIPCPSCFNMTESIVLSVEALLHEPVSDSWFDTLPPVGSCTVDFEGPSFGVAVVNAGTSASLVSGNKGFELDRDSDNVYWTELTTNTDLAPGAWYDFSAPGGSDLDAVDLPDILEVPEGFNISSPKDLLESKNALAFSAAIDKSGQTFSWSPSGSGTFGIGINVYSEDDGTYLGSVTCRGNDTGQLHVPQSALSGFPTWSSVAVFLTRYTENEGVLSNNGSTVQSVAEMSALGTGYLSP